MNVNQAECMDSVVSVFCVLANPRPTCSSNYGEMVLKSWTVIVDLSISSCRSVRFCFVYFEGLSLST